VLHHRTKTYREEGGRLASRLLEWLFISHLNQVYMSLSWQMLSLESGRPTSIHRHIPRGNKDYKKVITVNDKGNGRATLMTGEDMIKGQTKIHTHILHSLQLKSFVKHYFDH
jgi:hypothetical protein